MKRTLYLKFVLAYLIFGFFGFVVVATFTSSMTLEHLKRERADAKCVCSFYIQNAEERSGVRTIQKALFQL